MINTCLNVVLVVVGTVLWLVVFDNKPTTGRGKRILSGVGLVVLLIMYSFGGAWLSIGETVG